MRCRGARLKPRPVLGACDWDEGLGAWLQPRPSVSWAASSARGGTLGECPSCAGRGRRRRGRGVAAAVACTPLVTRRRSPAPGGRSGKPLHAGYSGRPMRVTKASVTRVCAICDRSLLMGEHTIRFSPDGSEYVDVCPLCQDVALDHGWVREGHAVSAALQNPARRRKQKPLWQVLLGSREPEAEPVMTEPILRRLSDDELALVESADLFNQSQFRRTIAGVDEEPGRAAGLDRAAARRQRRERADLRLGHHLVPVPRLARRLAARPHRGPRPGRRRSSRPRSPSGTPRSATTGGCCRTSRCGSAVGRTGTAWATRSAVEALARPFA